MSVDVHPSALVTTLYVPPVCILITCVVKPLDQLYAIPPLPASSTRVADKQCSVTQRNHGQAANTKRGCYTVVGAGIERINISREKASRLKGTENLCVVAISVRVIVRRCQIDDTIGDGDDGRKAESVHAILINPNRVSI